MSALTGKKLDQYLLIQQIGQGGMATVYRGENTETGEVVALKVLSPTISGDRRFVLRFRREGGLVSRLRHPHIIPVKDYGEDTGLIYLAMPFVEGDTLLERYRRGGLTPQLAARWMSQVAEALHYAHEQGVIHRDIKPANIIIDEEEKAKLGDFGLARTIEGTSSLTGSMLMGTPAYMSPEQVRGEKLDARSDQYSFGVILYQLFTGRLPFDGETPMKTAMMHLNDPVPSLRKHNPEVSSALERVIQTSLAKDPAARFPTVRALNTAFQAALRGDPLEWLQPTLAVSGDEASALRAEVQTPVEQPVRPARPFLLAIAALALVAVLSLAIPPVREAVGLGGMASGGEPTEAPVVAASPSLPTATVPLPTATPLPTSPPPVESSSCAGLRAFGFRATGNQALLTLDNGTERTIVLEDMLEFEAPASNQAVERIELGGELIFQGPAVAGEWTWLEGANRSLGAGEIKELAITFAWEAAPRGYRMDLVFNGGCNLEGNW